jgi:hypothetical protein
MEKVAGWDCRLHPHFHIRYRPFFDVNGGFLAFTKDTPIPGTRRVNMTLDFGPGVYIPPWSQPNPENGCAILPFFD